MPAIELILAGDGAWLELDKDKVPIGNRLQVAVLRGGMVSGAPSLAIRVDFPDGHPPIVVETSLALFIVAAKVLEVHFAEALPLAEPVIIRGRGEKGSA